jgi:hypothetical protein
MQAYLEEEGVDQDQNRDFAAQKGKSDVFIRSIQK